jgi:hypothetical protein
MIGIAENRISKVVEKLRQIELEISTIKGNFTLFALIEREDSLGKWDVVVSVQWVDVTEKELINNIAFNIHNKLTKEEQLMLSRIVVLPSSDPLVQNLNLIGVEHGSVKLSNNTFNGIVIKEAFLITSKR